VEWQLFPDTALTAQSNVTPAILSHNFVAQQNRHMQLHVAVATSCKNKHGFNTTFLFLWASFTNQSAQVV